MITDFGTGVNSTGLLLDADQPALGQYIAGNAQAINGSYRPLHPHSCGTAACQISPSLSVAVIPG